MNEKDLREVTTLLEDRQKICGWLRNIDHDRKEGFQYFSGFNHKPAAEFLLQYRSGAMAKLMEAHLIGILNDIEMRVEELGVKPNEAKTTFVEPPTSGGANGAVGSFTFRSYEPKPHFYSGKTV